MWQKDTAPGTYTWQQALTYCENLTLTGYKDWRLPNINELVTLVDYSRHSPAIHPVFIDTMTYLYWSSTTNSSWYYRAEVVDFNDGYAGGGMKSGSWYVRAVRGYDIDRDGILDDGDNSGTPGDNPCVGGETENCDDNCPDVYNPGQTDIDSDGIGDVCDNCPNLTNTGQEDTDSDGLGDACDNCPDKSNPNQEDTDSSGVGNACNDAIDADGDEWEDSLDNCPNFASQNQEDTDGDNIGNVCDPCPNDYENDSDSDSICGDIDSCHATPNGLTLGTCAKLAGGVLIGTGVTCLGYEDCEEDEICDMVQGDCNGNGIGDACECYADCNCSTKVDLADLVLMKREFQQPPVHADCNGDNQVNLGDLVIMKTQFMRIDCPACP